MARLKDTLLLCLLRVALAWGQEVDMPCDNGELITGNPIGTCAYESHLWVGDGCHEGFFCSDISGYGCHIVS